MRDCGIQTRHTGGRCVALITPSDSLPWEDIPESTTHLLLRKFLNGCIYTTAAPIALIAFTLALWPFVVDEQGGSLWENLGMYAFWMLNLAFLLLLYMAHARINRVASYQRMNGFESVPPLSMIGSGWFRTFRSDQAIYFENGLAEVDGTLSSTLRIDLIGSTSGVFFFSFCSVFRPASRMTENWELFGTILSVILVLGWIISLIFMVRSAARPTGNNCVVSFVDRDIAFVHCRGPLVEIEFSNSPAPGIHVLQIYPSRFFRSDFFRDFNTTFPHRLPGEYQYAAQRIGSRNSPLHG